MSIITSIEELGEMVDATAVSDDFIIVLPSPLVQSKSDPFPVDLLLREARYLFGYSFIVDPSRATAAIMRRVDYCPPRISKAKFDGGTMIHGLVKELGKERLEAALLEWLDENIGVIQAINEDCDFAAIGIDGRGFSDFALICEALWSLRDHDAYEAGEYRHNQALEALIAEYDLSIDAIELKAIFQRGLTYEAPDGTMLTLGMLGRDGAKAAGDTPESVEAKMSQASKTIDAALTALNNASQKRTGLSTGVNDGD